MRLATRFIADFAKKVNQPEINHNIIIALVVFDR